MVSKKKRPAVGVGVFIRNEHGQYLLGRRRGSHGSGEWSLPGGHIEWFEDFDETCIREIKEETNLDITNIKQIAFTNDKFPEHKKHYITLFFSADVKKNSKKLKNMEPEKCDGWGWFYLGTLPAPLFKPLESLITLVWNSDDRNKKSNIPRKVWKELWQQ